MRHRLLRRLLVIATVCEEQLVLQTVQGVPLPKTLKSKLSDGSMRHLLLRRLLVIATKTWVGVIVSSSLMIGSISVPCATWIVDVKPGTSGM
jgi:hypothetical protein